MSRRVTTDGRRFQPLRWCESWPVEVQLHAGDRWRKGRMRLDQAGRLTVWTARPFRQYAPGTVHAVYAESILARLILDRRGWPLVGSAERSGA